MLNPNFFLILKGFLSLLRVNRTAMILFVFILVWWNPGIIMAVGPLEEFQGLTAGRLGPGGYQDGSFNQAQFNNPAGLALSSDCSTIYVADQANHLIRTISLNQENEVGTLAGIGKPGNVDGPFLQAAFNCPSALAPLPGDRLAVFDQGNSLIRVLDFKSQSVSVLAGNGKAGGVDGPALKASLSDVWNMAYYPPNHCLYFSQPGQGLLRRVSLDDLKTETILSGDIRIPHPAALCVIGNNLYVANAGVTGVILCLKPTAAKDAKPLDRFSIEPAGQGRFITALAGSEGFLYGTQADQETPLQEFIPKAMPVSLISFWGEPYSKNCQLSPFFFADPSVPVGFITDPLSKGHFFLGNFNGNYIASVRDLNQGELSVQGEVNSSGLGELEYPLQKPPRTLRILIVGRSEVSTAFMRWPGQPQGDSNRMETLSKRLELFLNLSASLEDQPLRFEVFNCGQIKQQSVYLWPMDVVPDLVKKYDIDLVLLAIDPGTHIDDYYQFPPNPQGLPSYNFDPEYALKPFKQRVPPGEPQKLYDLCVKNKLLNIISDTQVGFHGFDELIGYPDIRDCLLEMIGKPLDVLHQRLKAIQLSSGISPRLELCYLPNAFPNPGIYRQPDFWRQLTQKWDINLMDLSDIFEAQLLALQPTNASDGSGHFDNNGTLWLNFVLMHELISQKIIPWTTPQR